MVVALASLPWREPWRRSRRSHEDPIRRVRNILRRIEANGPCELYRAELVRAIRRLLAPDYWDGPLSAA